MSAEGRLLKRDTDRAKISLNSTFWHTLITSYWLLLSISSSPFVDSNHSTAVVEVTWSFKESIYRKHIPMSSEKTTVGYILLHSVSSPIQAIKINGDRCILTKLEHFKIHFKKKDTLSLIILVWITVVHPNLNSIELLSVAWCDSCLSVASNSVMGC